MKKIVTLLTVGLATLVSAYAQNSTTEINGVLKKKNLVPVKLFKVIDGRPVEISSSTPSADGRFGFLFKPEYKGFYALGIDGKGTAPKFKFYFKGNDKVSLEINDSTYVLKGATTKENQVLTQWHDLTFQAEDKAINFMGKNSTYKDFFPLFTKVVNSSKTFLNGKATGNKDFDQLMKETIKYDLAHYALQFLYTPRSAHPTKDDYTEYYKALNPDAYLGSATLLKFPYGAQMIGTLLNFKTRDSRPKYDVATFADLIPNDVLKGEYVISRTASMKSYSDFVAVKDQFKKYFITTDQKQRIADITNKLATFKTGEKAINFSYPDVTGKQVSLTDFKGKLVLVDVWATWCGPCKAEIPALTALEEEFHDKDVVFMSVSVDEKKADWDKWMKEKAPKGVQLFANGWTEITKSYQINGIPRFMLFDRNGNIVTIDSPRPSDPKLKDLLNEWLNKKA